MLSKLCINYGISLVVFSFILLSSHGTSAENRLSDGEIPLWPSGAPGSQNVNCAQTYVDRSKTPDVLNREVYGINQPSIIPMLAPEDKANGTAVIICPGGGYRVMAIDKEGFDIARWFNSMGVSAFVLKYRLPSEGHQVGYKVPLQDAQRAMRLVRQNANKWGIDANKVGIMGFSAGGHVASTLGTKYSETTYDQVDGSDMLSAKPNFMILIYPVISMQDGVTHVGSKEKLLGRAPDKQLVDAYSNELHVDKDTPQTFIVQANDDSVSVLNSAYFYTALKKAGVDAEYHVFRRGGHGYGLGIHGGPVALWPELCKEWLITTGKVKND